MPRRPLPQRFSQPPTHPRWRRLLWCRLPATKGLALLICTLALTLVVSERPVRAERYVATPRGNCLHARRQPRIAGDNVVTCVANGAPLKPRSHARRLVATEQRQLGLRRLHAPHWNRRPPRSLSRSAAPRQ
ncbi:MAG: hypothetical protein HC838_04565 [Spirulinaceae cyanobacterium RM2_2_10]|nr:hypothetical protein [Spirulinaceae cyanobacterium RM2_2_10]